MTEPIRVAHVIARLNVGGAALHVMMLAAHLRPPEHPDFQGELICGVVSAGEADMRYVADELNLPVHTLPELGREITLRGDLTAIWKLYRYFRKTKPDIVHTNTAKAGFVGRLAARLAGVPVILHTFHGHVFQGYFGKRKTRVFLELERICARFSDAVITLSQELKRQITEDYHVCAPSRVEVLPIGFDLHPFAEFRRADSSFRAEHNIPADAPLVGIIGRLVPIKNHDLFLAAAALVHQQRPDVHFFLVGDGERREEIGAQVDRLGLQDVTTFAGWIVNTHPVYATLDVVVLSSKNEGVPVSIIEAMAARVPVVSTRVGGVPDLILKPEFGLVVPPDDAQAMAAAILRAIEKQGFDLDGAQQHVFDTYDVSQVTRRHAALYQKLLSRKRR